MPCYQQGGSGLAAGRGDICAGFVSGVASNDFGEGTTLGTAGPYHPGGSAAGVLSAFVEVLCVVLSNRTPTLGSRWRRNGVHCYVLTAGRLGGRPVRFRGPLIMHH